MMNIATLNSTATPTLAQRQRHAGLPEIALGLLLLFAATASFAALRAELDRDAVREGETLRLILEADSAKFTGQPDLAPLRKDFHVLGTSVSTEINSINGRSSSRTRWLVQLQPRRPGKLLIPAIALGNEQSAPLELDVSEASQPAEPQTGQHIFLEAEVPKGTGTLRLAQQIPYTLRLYYDDALREGSLDSPQADNAMIEQLGEEKRYDTMRDSRRLHVIERRYAITAEKSGQLRIPPVSFRGRVAGGEDSGRRSTGFGGMMDDFLRQSPFANDPMFKNSLANFPSFADPGKPVTVQSQAVTLDIQPRPAAAGGSQWLPAERVTLIDSWSEHSPEFKVGEPVTRTITIEADGLTGAQIPELAVAQPANARLYREASSNASRSDGELIHGISKQNITYIPTAQGPLAIPSVALDWWNTRSNSQSRATLPQRKFEVQPGVAGAAAMNAMAAPAVAPAAEAGTRAVKQPVSPPANAIAERLKSHWPYVAGGGLLLLVMIAALAIGGPLRRTRQQSGKTEAAAQSPPPEPKPKALLRALREACDANDGRAAASALLALSRARWPEDPPRSLGALAARLAHGGEEVRALDRSLYAPNASNWTGTALWTAMSDGVREKPEADRQPGDGLDPLYQ